MGLKVLQKLKLYYVTDHYNHRPEEGKQVMFSLQGQMQTIFLHLFIQQWSFECFPKIMSFYAHLCLQGAERRALTWESKLDFTCYCLCGASEGPIQIQIFCVSLHPQGFLILNSTREELPSSQQPRIASALEMLTSPGHGWQWLGPSLRSAKLANPQTDC